MDRCTRCAGLVLSLILGLALPLGCSGRDEPDPRPAGTSQSPVSRAPGWQLRAGVRESKTLEPKQVHRWSFSLRAGQSADVELDGGDLIADLLDPAGKWARTWWGTPQLALTWVARSEGIWNVEVRSSRCTPDNYDVVLRDVHDANDAEQALSKKEEEIGENLASGDIAAATRAVDSLLTLALTEGSRDPRIFAQDINAWGARFFSPPPSVTGENIMLAKVLAVRLIDHGLETRRKAFGSDSEEVATSLVELATLKYVEQDLDGAEDLARRALNIRRRRLSGQDPLLAESLHLTAKIFYSRGRPSDALAPASEALAILEVSQPNTKALADCLNTSGEIGRMLGEYEKAETYFVRAAEIARCLADTGGSPREAHILLARILNNHAGVLKDTGNYARAEELAARSRRLREAIEPPDLELLATASLSDAEIYWVQGNSESAVPGYAKALETARTAYDAGHPWIAYYLGPLARALAETGQYKDAEAAFREALGIMDRFRLSNELRAQTLHDLASVLARKGAMQDAKKTYGDALALRERVYGPRTPEVADTLTELAAIEIAGGGQEAKEGRRHLARALQTLGSVNSRPALLVKAMALRADDLKAQGDAAGAIRQMEKALRLVESMRPESGGGEMTRAQFGRKYLSLYRRMIDWQMAAHRPAEAFGYAERIRGRVLLDQIAVSGIDLENEVDPSLRETYLIKRRAALQKRAKAAQELGLLLHSPDSADIRAMIAALRNDVGAAEREFQEVSERMMNESRSWRRVSTALHVPLPAVQRSLVPRDGLILLYQLGPNASYVFIVPQAPRSLEAVPLVVGAEDARTLGIPAGPLKTEDLARVIRATEGSGSPPSSALRGLGRARAAESEGTDITKEDKSATDEFAATAKGLHALWRILLPRDLWNRVAHSSEVVIVPDGALHWMPFEALVTVPGPSATSTRFWLDEGPPVR